MNLNLTSHQITMIDMDFKDHYRVNYFIGALLYFEHERLNTNLKVVSITGQLRIFNLFGRSFFLLKIIRTKCN